MLVIIALPDRHAGRVVDLIDPFGHGGFICPDDGGEGMSRRGDRWGAARCARTKGWLVARTRGDIARGRGDRRGGARSAHWGIIINHNDPMHVIGHDAEFIQCHIRSELGSLVPFLQGNLAQGIQPHHPVNDPAEQPFPLVGIHGDEVRAGLGVIVSLQADGAAVMERFHYIYFTG